MRSVETVVFLVVLATVVAAFAGRIRVPAPSLLVVAGLAVGLLPWVPPVRIPPDVVGLVVLPPLLYAAAEDVSWRDLRTVWRPVTVLAVGLVLATAAAVAAVAVATAALPASMAFVLGAVLASTDPVAVSALGRRLSLPPRVQAVVQAESLFNDGTSLVLFQIAVGFAAGSMARMAAGAVALDAALHFVILAGGGVLAGAVVAAGAIAVRRRITDPVLETVAALLTPYVAYLLGEAAHLSGVTAVIVAGLVISTRRGLITTAQTRLQLHSVFGTVVFLLESVVFALIGLQLPGLIGTLASTSDWLPAALAVCGTLLATRVAWVFPLYAAAEWGRGRRPSWAVPAVVTWAGTRGVVPLAAALSIPLTTADGTALPDRDLVLVLAAVAIAVSLVVQGFTLEPLARFAGMSQRPGTSTEHEEAVARLRLAEAGLTRLDELAGGGAAPDPVIDRLRAGLRARIGASRATADPEESGLADGSMTERQLRGDLIEAQAAELGRLYANGTISLATRNRLQQGLDLEAARLSGGGQR